MSIPYARPRLGFCKSSVDLLIQNQYLMLLSIYIGLWLRVSDCIYVCLFVCLAIHPSIHPSEAPFYSSFLPSVYIYLSIYLSTGIYLSIYTQTHTYSYIHIYGLSSSWTLTLHYTTYYNTTIITILFHSQPLPRAQKFILNKTTLWLYQYFLLTPNSIEITKVYHISSVQQQNGRRSRSMVLQLLLVLFDWLSLIPLRVYDHSHFMHRVQIGVKMCKIFIQMY